MTKLTRTFCAVAVAVTVVVAFLAFQVVTGQSVAFAQASCNRTTEHQNGNILVPVPSDNGNFNCIVGIGNSGSAVSDLQQSLNHCYRQHLTVDGQYGSLTAAAMKVAQRDLGVTQDGTYGPHTRSAGFLFWGVTVRNPHAACGPAGF